MERSVTILSPVRNEETHIEQCLSSLVNQTTDVPLEILVIDGMSSDHTREIIQSFMNRHDTITMLDNPKKTVPYALNIGLEHAMGTIIIRVDGHARIESDYVSRCLEALDQTGADCVGGAIESINTTTTGKAIALAMSSPFGVGNARFRTSGKAGYVDTLAFGAYPGSLFDRIGAFDTELVRCQDDEFNYRLRKAGGRIYFDPEIRSWYYPRQSLSHLWKQYYQYGTWKVRVLQKHSRMMQPRQFVPVFFVLSLIVTGLTAVVWLPSLFFFLFIVTLYLFLSILVSIKLASLHGWSFFWRLPLIFALLHLSYGMGFLYGVVRFRSHFFKSTHSPYRHTIVNPEKQ